MRDRSDIVPAKFSSEELLLALAKSYGSFLEESKLDLGDAVIRIRREQIKDFFKTIKADNFLCFEMLSSLTAVDWMDLEGKRFELVYHLLSITNNVRLRVKAWVPEGDAEVESIAELWASADFLEREVWDMFGIKFKGHPNLRRVLMYEEFVGHPLRKDYPVQAKQPRIKMRSPEVINTATLMRREPLVRINPKKGSVEKS